ncbi:NAD-dependent protein deacetylase [subsurface metagenome]
MMDIKKPVKIAEAILESSKVVVLTGAGISTESGIPDFRSPGGIWSKFDPGVMTSSMLYGNPVGFYKQAVAMLSFLKEINSAKPNRAHYILAEMEKEGYLSCVITQNIDGLHKKAGSEKVYEVHGNLRGGYCMSCGRKIGFDLLVEKVRSGVIPPVCDSCGGILRPDAVLFGDELPECFIEATAEVEGCDLLLVIGSSLEVTPVNSLPAMAKRYVIINRERTYYDRRAYTTWNEKASSALEAIYKEIKRRVERSS